MYVMRVISIYSYPNGNAIMNVMTGTMLTKAQAKVADVYWIPKRKKYCVTDALQKIIHYVSFYNIDNPKIDDLKQQ